MSYRNAVFDPDWLKNKDPRCRFIAKDYWWDKGPFIITDNPNKFDVDTLISQPDRPPHAALELEYTADRWRFSNGLYRSKYHAVSVPVRKEKWFRFYKETYWMSFSYDFNHYILIPGYVILRYDDVKEYSVYNNVNKKEKFFMIPQSDPHTEPKPVPHDILRRHNIPVI